MTRPGRRARLAFGLIIGVVAVYAAGCGSEPAVRPVVSTARAVAEPLDTSAVMATGTWAVVVMGGSAGHNNFWQLFTRPVGSNTWRLVTPPGTADNGGLVLASGGRATITAFRPSQYLSFTPLIRSADGGTRWSSLSPLEGALARTPDGLAQAPGGQLLALLTTGTVTTARLGGPSWHAMVTRRFLAATRTGRDCGLAELTAAAYSPSGTPLLGGACTRPGAAGIFALVNGTWRAAGPAMPLALSRSALTVIRLTRSADQVEALLTARAGKDSSLLAAWSANGTDRWTLSRPLPIGATAPITAFIGTGRTAVQLSARHGEVASPRQPWKALPTLPPGTSTLAAGPGGAIDALAARGTALTIWRNNPGSDSWMKIQTMKVPIQYGSSG